MGRTTRAKRAVMIGVVVALSAAWPAGSAGAASTWVRNPAPNPSPTSNLLRSVSCPTPTTCVAVGMRHDEGVYDWRPLIERTTDGVRWNVMRTPTLVPGYSANQLEGVSCADTTNCTAVGFGSSPPQASPITGPVPATPLVLSTSDGTTWDRIYAPSSGGQSRLFAVSCAAPFNCTAVGQVANKTLILQVSPGSSWVRRRSPNPGLGINHLDGVSCVSPTSCTAVGYFSQGDEVSPRRTLVLRTTNGVTWSRVKSPNASPDPGLNQLTDVSCSGPSTCTAVGLITRDASTVKRAFLLRTTDGITWNRLTATPTTAGELDLLGVSCSSPTACTAVGLQRTAGNTAQRPFIVHTTNGTAWTEQPSPDPGTFARTLAVSCAVVNLCTAIGDWSGARPDNQLRALVLKEI